MTSLPAWVCGALLLRSVLASLPAPVHVTLTSSNFLHVLQWDPGPGTPPGTTYEIETRANRKRQGLVSTASTSCTLTLDKFWTHHLRVRASYDGTRSPWSSAVVFTPYEDNVLGPPSLALARLDSDIQINISLPDTLDYGASFVVGWRTGSRTRETRTTKHRSFTLWAPEEGQHCFQVRLQTEINAHTPWSPWSCITTAAAERSTGLAAVHVLVPVLVLIIFLSMLTCGLHYVGLLCSPVPLLDMLRELEPAQIHKTLLKPDRTPVEIPVCHGILGEEDHEGWSNIYINRRAPTCSDAASSGRVMEDSAQDSAQDSSGSGGAEGSGPQDQAGPGGGTASEHLSSDEEEEVQSEEDCVDLFSVTVAALTDAQTHLSQPPPPRLESHDPGYECRGSRWTPGLRDDSEDETVGSSGYVRRT